MKVLFLSPSAGLGGAERALIETFRALRTQDPSWTLGLIALEEGPLVAEALGCGVDVTVLPMPSALAGTGESGRTLGATLLRLGALAGPALALARQLRAAVRAWSPDLVHSNGIKTHVLGAWCRPAVPLVWHVHDYLSTRPVSARLLRHHRRSAAAIVANSHSVADDARTVLGRASRIETVYNAVDLTRFDRSGSRLDLDAACGLPSAPPGTLRVGLIATFARWKGHAVFLRAIAALNDRPRLRAYVIGGPVYRTGLSSQTTLDELHALVDSLGLEGTVGFSGFLDDPAPAYRALDIVVHASTSPEPFGLSIAEAMATGRAVVISDAGGAREIGEPERTCVAHPPGDVAALRDQLARLIAEEPLRARLGRDAATAVRERFTHAAHAAALGALYRRLAREACPA